MPPPRRLLRLVARTELLSLAVLLANLATVHQRALASVVGPLHGCAYLIAVIATATASSTPTAGDRGTGADRSAILLAAIPGVGGVLALRRLDAPSRERPADAAGSPRTEHAPREAPPGA